MAKTLGSGATLRVSEAGVTYTVVGKIKSISRPMSVSSIDATDNDSGGYKERLAGDADFKLSVTANYDPADAGQQLVRTAANEKDILYFEYRPQGAGATLPQYIGQGIITSANVDATHEEMMEFSFDVDITGNMALTAQGV